MEISDETLMAYVDGELPSAEAKQIAEAIQGDAALAERVRRFRAVRHALRSAYDSVLKEPVPDRLRALMHDVELSEPAAGAVVDLASKRANRRFSVQAAAALAACLIGGVLVGRMMQPDSVFTGGDGDLRAGSALARVLDTRLASAADNESADLRVGVSFRAKSGQYCRTFEAHGEQGLAGLACRDGDAWAIRVAIAQSAHGGYAQAGAPPIVMNAVDAIIEGDPLDAAQEQNARDQHWK